MTDSTATAAAGWYDDPAGSGQKRWWDGTQWSEHLHDPSLEVYGVVAKPVVGAGTPVYNAFIWADRAVAAHLDSGSSHRSTWPGTCVRTMNGSSVLRWQLLCLFSLIGWVIYLVSVLLAYFDWKRLGRDGYVRPFHWAWAFLSAPVYIIGRSVIVKRRSGRGLLADLGLDRRRCLLARGGHREDHRSDVCGCSRPCQSFS